MSIEFVCDSEIGNEIKKALIKEAKEITYYSMGERNEELISEPLSTAIYIPWINGNSRTDYFFRVKVMVEKNIIKKIFAYKLNSDEYEKYSGYLSCKVGYK